MATQPGAWCYRVSAGIGWHGFSILWLGEVESLICNFYLNVEARKLSVQIRPWDTLACCWDFSKQQSNPKLRVGLRQVAADLPALPNEIAHLKRQGNQSKL